MQSPVAAKADIWRSDRIRYDEAMEELATLIEAKRPRLAQMLDEPQIEIVEHRAGHCSIAAPGLIPHFYRRPKSAIIDSSVELRAPPAHAVKLSDHVYVWMILKSRGEEWPEAAPDDSASNLLNNELDRLSRALEVLRDERMMLETLLWEAGYRKGYLAWG